MAANEAEQAAGGNNPAAAATTTAAACARPAATTLDPELIMAARCGDSKRLRQLLQMLQCEEQVVPAAGRAQQFVVQVHPLPAAGAAPVAPEPCGAAEAASSALDGVTPNEGDSLLHVAAACGDGKGFIDCAQMIYHGKRGLLTKRNKKDDTPLHCAAGAGNAKMISCLAALATGDERRAMGVKELLRMRNKCGETALHKAVSAASKDCIDQLMLLDPELGCFPDAGDDEKGVTTTSPLYLAISLGDMEIVQHLWYTSNRELSYSGPYGRNVLHAAVSRVQVLDQILKLFRNVTVKVTQGDHRTWVHLLSHLIKQRDKQTGSTPLHLAAALAGWPFLRLLCRLFPRLGPVSKPVKMLLDAVQEASKCSLYQPDNEGLYPIHVAAMTGSLAVVKILLKSCPDCATLRDGKGRTFLHVAVEQEKYSVVQYACRKPEYSSILNAQDRKGNTALHRAVDVENLDIFNLLIRNKHVRLDISNKKAIRPHDLSLTKINPGQFYVLANARCIIRLSLLLLGAPFGESRSDIFLRDSIPRIDKNKEAKDLTATAQVASVVAALVATVAFASAFALPGGYRAEGTPVLAGSYLFDALILADLMAFMCSCTAACSLVFAGVSAMDRVNRVWHMKFAETLMMNAVRSLVTALGLGLFLILAPVAHTTAIMTSVMLWLSLIYCNSEGYQILLLANTARVRGTGGPMWPCVLLFFRFVARHYFSLMIIYGLPVIPRIVKLLHTKLS